MDCVRKGTTLYLGNIRYKTSISMNKGKQDFYSLSCNFKILNVLTFQMLGESSFLI